MQTDKIEILLDKEGFNEICASCTFYQETYETHPYGSTFATETLADCLCESDNDCPRLK